MKDISAALGRLDPEGRALLDLSLRRGMENDDIAGAVGIEAEEVGRRRQEAFEKLAADLGIDDREQREELMATLPDLPPEMWNSARS